MKSIFILCLLVSSSLADAQNYESTGSARLWAPQPPVTNPVGIVDVPNYGVMLEGAVVKRYAYQIFNNGAQGRTEIGICTANKNGPGLYKLVNNRWEWLCPTESKPVMIYIDEYSTSDGGG